jgi:hypothetical protein
MSQILRYLKATAGRDNTTAAVLCQCNYSNNYYGDQVCQIGSGKRLKVGEQLLGDYARSHG